MAASRTACYYYWYIGQAAADPVVRTACIVALFSNRRELARSSSDASGSAGGTWSPPGSVTTSIQASIHT